MRIPDFIAEPMKAVFGFTVDLTTLAHRPFYQIKVKHEFDLGGFDIKPGPSIDLDPMGLEWIRTVELTHRTNHIGYRMMVFDDLGTIIHGYPGPSPEMLEKMYGATKCSV